MGISYPEKNLHKDKKNKKGDVAQLGWVSSAIRRVEAGISRDYITPSSLAT